MEWPVFQQIHLFQSDVANSASGDLITEWTLPLLARLRGVGGGAFCGRSRWRRDSLRCGSRLAMGRGTLRLESAPVK